MDRKILQILPIIGFFFIVFTYHTLYRHWTYNSHAFDLGIYTQATYLYSKGQMPLSSLKHMNILGDHFGPVLFLLSPFYKLFPYPETLLIIQALFVSLSGIFIYLIALDKLKNKLKSLLITCIYLSFSGILTAVNFDFHLATISVLPLTIMLYAWYFQRWRLYFFSIFLALLFKEDIPLFVVGLGITSILHKQKRVGIITILLGLMAYWLIKYQIMPKFSPGAENAYINTAALTLTDPSKFPLIMFNSPIKIHTLLTLYGQFIFLPFLSLLSWLTVFPYLFLRFSSDQTHYWGLYFQYNSNLAPFLTISAMFALSKIKIQKFLSYTLLIAILLLQNLFLNNLVIKTMQYNIWDGNRFNYINSALKIIPANSSVSAQSPIVPHLANRNKVYLYPEVLDADYIILDESLDYYPMQKTEFKDKVTSLKNSSAWILEKRVNSLLIFKKG